MNRYWGQTLESFLSEEGILEEADAHATRQIFLWQLPESMRECGVSKAELANRIDVPPETPENFWEPSNWSLNLVEKAASVPGRRARIELIPAARATASPECIETGEHQL